jgi:hypothetical protein
MTTKTTAELLAGPPTAAAQRAVMAALSELVEPLLASHRIHVPFTVEPGFRLRRRYGQCRHFSDGQPARISVRCTRHDQPAAWRRQGALVHTLLHELAHLKHRGHSAAFWRLCRAMVDDAAARGWYDPRQDDPTERSSGLEKLAGSAAQPLARAARGARRERSRAARQLMTGWDIGAQARLRVEHGRLARAVVRIVEKRRTRVLVETPRRRRYLVPVHMLEPA